jgi:hypothetical protein
MAASKLMVDGADEPYGMGRQARPGLRRNRRRRRGRPRARPPSAGDPAGECTARLAKCRTADSASSDGRRRGGRLDRRS